MPSIAALDLIKESLIEINAHAPGESLSSEEASFALSKLNAILDTWSSRPIMAYVVEFNEYTLTPNLQPHTIGPSGATFTATQRPVKIESASLILNTSAPDVHVPLRIVDKDEWARVMIPAMTSTMPGDLYYAPTFPNGSIYLWPVPTVAYGLKIETWGLLAQIATLATAVNLPPAYKEALVLTLALRLAPAFGKRPSDMTLAAHLKAMAAVQGPNTQAPKIMTRDIGVPGGDGGLYDIRTGGFK